MPKGKAGMTEEKKPSALPTLSRIIRAEVQAGFAGLRDDLRDALAEVRHPQAARGGATLSEVQAMLLDLAARVRRLEEAGREQALDEMARAGQAYDDPQPLTEDHFIEIIARALKTTLDAIRGTTPAKSDDPNV